MLAVSLWLVTQEEKKRLHAVLVDVEANLIRDSSWAPWIGLQAEEFVRDSAQRPGRGIIVVNWLGCA